MCAYIVGKIPLESPNLIWPFFSKFKVVIKCFISHVYALLLPTNEVSIIISLFERTQFSFLTSYFCINHRTNEIDCSTFGNFGINFRTAHCQGIYPNSPSKVYSPSSWYKSQMKIHAPLISNVSNVISCVQISPIVDGTSKCLIN